MTKSPIIKTPMLRRYLLKFIIRILIFTTFFATYIKDKSLLSEFVNTNVSFGITPLHLLWFVFMVMMILHLFPREQLSMALRKSQKEQYSPVTDYDELALLKYIQNQNIKAWTVLLVWLLANSVFGLLYLANVMDEADLFMLSVFYFLCDYICILFFCPFQTFIMKNRCCVNCRIYDWGHFMMFTPMLFIQNFYSWSLFLTSVVVLIHWEIIYAKHPERFWDGSNESLKCANCKDKTCQIKSKRK